MMLPRLKQIRKYLKLSQKNFAKEIGIQIVTFTDHPNSELSETFDYSVALASFENQGLASINLQSIMLPDSSDVMVMVNYIDEKTDLNI